MDPESSPWLDGAPPPWSGDGTSPERWLAAARADEVIAERRARSVHTFLSLRETTLAGALAMAGEHGDEVTIWTRSERQIAGPVHHVGVDWVAVETLQGRTWVALAAVDRVTTPHRRIGTRAVAGPKLVDAIADGISPGDVVVVWTTGRARVTGRFAGCGADVILIDGAGGRTLVGVQSLEVVLVGSG